MSYVMSFMTFVVISPLFPASSFFADTFIQLMYRLAPHVRLVSAIHLISRHGIKSVIFTQYPGIKSVILYS